MKRRLLAREWIHLYRTIDIQKVAFFLPDIFRCRTTLLIYHAWLQLQYIFLAPKDKKGIL
jgi:hypothetical protein